MKNSARHRFRLSLLLLLTVSTAAVWAEESAKVLTVKGNAMPKGIDK